MTGLVLAAHGTRNSAGRDCVDQMRSALARRLGVAVGLGWVDVSEPHLADVLRDGDVVVPAFLGNGYHVRHDVPEAAGRHRDVVITPHLGPDPLVVDALEARVVEAGGPWPLTLVGWAGSSDRRSRAEAEQTADALARRWPGLQVVLATPSRGAELVQRAHDEGLVVGIATYLLAPGFFHDKLAALAPGATSAPIGPHPSLVEALARRAGAALAGQDGPGSR